MQSRVFKNVNIVSELLNNYLNSNYHMGDTGTLEITSFILKTTLKGKILVTLCCR